MSSPSKPPAECANCGAEIPRTAKACPECGADERTGWRENDDTRYDGLDLPESAFTDDKAPSRPEASSRHVNGIAWYWWCVGVALLMMLAVSFLR
ncbi:MAG: zinc-ribbon domain-containing protein [Verrucomicrobiota bacterium]